MKSWLRRSLLLIILIFTLSTALRATTWAPHEVVCPICKTKNTFLQPMSFGNYIYMWPSKYQYIFWPYIDSPVLYSCKKCHLTAFMGDFEKLPQDKLPAIEKMLASVSLPGKTDEYTKIPMTQRLVVAEKVYSILGQDDDWWCHFYRVEGYHFAAEEKKQEAAAARKKALDLAEKMLGQQANNERRKELLLIRGAMRYFLEDVKGALQDLDEASKLKYQNASIEQANAEGLDNYLSALIKDYVESINDAEVAKTEPVWPHKKVDEHKGWVMTLAVSPDSSTVAAADIDRGLILWDAQAGTLRRKLPERNVIQAVAFSADGKLLASGGYNSVVDIWNPQTGELLRSLTGHKGYVSALAFSRDGKLLASGSWDETIKLWDTETWKVLRTIKQSDAAWDLSFSPDGNTLATTIFKGPVRLFETRTGEPVTGFHPLKGDMFVAFSPDGKTLATSGGEDNAVLLLDARTGAVTQTLKGHKRGVVAASFSPDGETLASVAWDGTLRLWELKSGTLLRLLTKRGGQFRAVAFTPDGKLVVTGGNDRTIRFWDVRSDTVQKTTGIDPATVK